MSNEELKKEAMKKKRNGCATQSALKAQMELYERIHWIENKPVDDWYGEQDILDIQYNGSIQKD